MELFIAIFIGVWMCAASVISFFWLKKELKPYLDKAKSTSDSPIDVKEGDR